MSEKLTPVTGPSSASPVEGTKRVQFTTSVTPLAEKIPVNQGAPPVQAPPGNEATPAAPETSPVETASGTSHDGADISASHEEASVSTPASGDESRDVARERWVKAEKRRLETERELKAAAAAAEELRRELAAEKEFRTTAKRNPLAALEKLGLTFEDVAKYVLNDGKPSPEDAAAQAVADLKTEMETKFAAAEKEKAEALRLQQHAAINDGVGRFFTDLNRTMTGTPDKFEFCSLHNEKVPLTIPDTGATFQVEEAIADAWALSNAYYEAHGTLPDPAQVMETLERAYEEEAFRLAEKSTKLRSKFAPAPSTGDTELGRTDAVRSPNGGNPKISTRPTGSPTLGSDSLRAVPSPAPTPGSAGGPRETDEERLRRVIAWGNANMRARR